MNPGAIKLATQEFIVSKAHIATYTETPPPPSSIILPSHDLNMAYYVQTATAITERTPMPLDPDAYDWILTKVAKGFRRA